MVGPFPEKGSPPSVTIVAQKGGRGKRIVAGEPVQKKRGGVNLNAGKNNLQRSPSPFPLPVGERGRGEGPKVTAGDVQQAMGKAICTPWNQGRRALCGDIFAPDGSS